MPKDIAGAVAEMGDISVEGDAPAVQDTAASTQTEAPAAAEPKADTTGAPAASTAALDEAKERLEAIREKRRAQREKLNLDGHKQKLSQYEEHLKWQAQEQAARQRQIDEMDGKWKAALKDPRKFSELGHDPLSLYKTITEAAAEADTPEGHAARLREAFEAQISARDAKIEEIRNEFAAFKKALDDKEQAIAQERHVALAQRLTTQLFDILKLDKYSDLTDAYENSQLVHMADAWHQGPLDTFDPQKAADAMLEWEQSKDQRRATRRKDRETAKLGIAGQPAGQASGAETRPLGNATATASASAPPVRKKTKAERYADAEAELGVLIRTTKS